MMMNQKMKKQQVWYVDVPEEKVEVAWRKRPCLRRAARTQMTRTGLVRSGRVSDRPGELVVAYDSPYGQLTLRVQS